MKKFFYPFLFFTLLCLSVFSHSMNHDHEIHNDDVQTMDTDTHTGTKRSGDELAQKRPLKRQKTRQTEHQYTINDLYNAFDHDDADLVDTIIVQQPDLLEQRNLAGQTPIFYSRYNCLNSFKALIRLGASTTTKDNDGVTLAESIERSNNGLRIIGWILDNPEQFTGIQNWNDFLRRGLECSAHTVLGHNSRSTLDLKKISIALAQGADVNSDAQICYAEYYDDGEYYPGCILTYINSLLGHSISLYARYKRRNDASNQSMVFEAVRILLKHGADCSRPFTIKVNSYNWLDQPCEKLINYINALHLAIDLDVLEIVKLLIDHGADIKKLYMSIIAHMSYYDRYYRHKQTITFIENYLGQGRKIVSDVILESTPSHGISANIADIIVDYLGSNVGDIQPLQQNIRPSVLASVAAAVGYFMSRGK